MDVLIPRPTCTLLLVGALVLLSSHRLALAVHVDAPHEGLISSIEAEQSYFADGYLPDDLSLEHEVADGPLLPAPPPAAPPPVMISMRPSLWTGAVTMLLLIPIFGRFRRRLFI